MRKFVRYLVLGFVLVCNTIQGQGLITPSQIIARADTLYDAKKTNKYLGDLVKKSQDELSLLEKLEFRTETDEWDASRQEYMVRASFKSKREKQAEKMIMESMLYDADIYIVEERANAVEDILNDLIDLKSKKDHLKLLSELSTITSDRERLLKAELIQEDKPDVLDIIKLEDEKLKLVIDVDDVKRDIRELKLRLKPDGKSDWDIDFKYWKSVEELSANVYQIKNSESTPLELLKKSIQVKERTANLNKEKAEGGKVLDFIQLKHAGRNDSKFGDELSLGVGIVIPTGHVNKTAILEAQIELAKEEWEYDNIEAQLGKEKKQAVRDFENTYQRLVEYKILIKKQGLNKKMTQLAANNASPSVLLDIQEMMLKRQMVEKELEKDVYEGYIEILEKYGKLLEGNPQIYLETN